MSSGLSRRRGGAGPSMTTSPPSASSPAVASPSTSRPTTPAPPAAHRVAYDERDMETGEERVMPKLTLMEEVLLLGLKDKQVSFVCYIAAGVGIGAGLIADGTDDARAKL